MKVIRGLENASCHLTRSVLTIGNFDGVHRGHQQILAQAGLFAARDEAPLVVLTFEPHPLSIVAPEKAPERLTPLPEKIRLLADTGVAMTVVADSNSGVLTTPAREFIREIIIPQFHPLHIVEGANFGFGKGRSGNNELLMSMGESLGFELFVVEPLRLEIDKDERTLVSSSLIRSLIREGKVHRAALCLGRPYTLIGHIIPGAKRGRSLGFPTANTRVADQLIPGQGVYAGRATVQDKTFSAAISIGTNPTFDGHTLAVEAHLLDVPAEFSADNDLLYEQPIRIELGKWLRGQIKFQSPADLVAQIEKDVAATRQWVALHTGRQSK